MNPVGAKRRSRFHEFRANRNALKRLVNFIPNLVSPTSSLWSAGVRSRFCDEGPSSELPLQSRIDKLVRFVAICV